MALRRATRNRQSSAKSPTPESIRTLNTEALRLHLDRHNLVTTGKRQELVERLLRWHASSHQDSETNSQEGGSESDPELDRTPTVPGSQHNSSSSDRGSDDGQADSSVSKEARSPDEDGRYTRGRHPNPRRRHHSHHQRDGRHAGRHQQHLSYHQRERAHTSSHRSHHQRDRGPTQRLKHSPTPLPSKYRNRLIRKHSHSQPSRRSRSPRSPQHTRRTRHAQHSPSSSDSSLDSSSSSLLSDSFDTHSDTSSSIERHHHHYRSKHHRNRRKHSYRHRHSSEDSWVADAVVSCAPPIPRHLRRNLKQGKYVNFTSLLLPMDPPSLLPGMQQHKGKSSRSMRSITDQQTWLEAWNRYASARIAYDPDIALSLVKYQTLMAMLFRQFTPKACIEYDRLFRQAAGQDAYLPWDCLNNQIFVYTFTPAHAHTPEVRDQTSPFHDAIQQPIQDRQFQRDHSFRLDHSVRSDRPFRDSGQQLAGERPPLASRLGPPPRPTVSNRVTHDASGTEICKRYNVGKCTLSNCRYAHSCWTPGCHGSHPGKGCPRRPK